ncbi:RASA2 protein, partial [Chloroceryle aenea]|nr:RASA2 protein [Chloroceryle aenea]
LQENLRYYVDKVFREIVRSSISCPTLMCDVFYSLRHLAAKRFPNDPHVQYSAVSSFVFLRFFAVAVVSPHTFHLRPHHPVSSAKLCSVLFVTVRSDNLGRHKLLLVGLYLGTKITKRLQLGLQFYTSPKELRICNSLSITFLDDVSSTESKEPSGLSEPVHLKEG